MKCTKTVIVLLIFFLLLKNVFANKPDDLTKAKTETNKTSNLLLLKYDFNNFLNFSGQDTNKIMLDEDASYKSPWLAFFLSLFLPTTGQLYNGDYTKALIQAALMLAGGGLVATMACVECGDSQTAQTALLITGAGMLFSGYLWSIIDAPSSANDHNRRMRRNAGLSLYSSDDETYSIKFNKIPISNSYIISFSADF